MFRGSNKTSHVKHYAPCPAYSSSLISAGNPPYAILLGLTLCPVSAHFLQDTYHVHLLLIPMTEAQLSRNSGHFFRPWVGGSRVELSHHPVTGCGTFL